MQLTVDRSRLLRLGCGGLIGDAEFLLDVVQSSGNIQESRYEMGNPTGR
jgi:hypothetical protein